MTDLHLQEFRQVQLITIKRQHVRIGKPVSPGGKYGHWWIEIGDPYDPASESYGWWPKQPVTISKTLLGVDGELNATTQIDTPFRDPTGCTVRDPHHGDSADEVFHPVVSVSDPRTDEQIAECIRSRAREYNGKWQWLLEGGQNCHTFQLALLDECQLLEPPKHRSRISRGKYAAQQGDE